MTNPQPTPYPDVNALVLELLRGVQTILGSHFIGMYLDGSLAHGDFDQASDVDFVVVSDEDISEELFSALYALHTRIAMLNVWWATQLEGSYFSQQALRRYDPTHAWHPNLERGVGERLKMVQHDEGWLIHLSILRERGITVVGPAPQTLIDPVSPDDLRQAMVCVLRGWATNILTNPVQMDSRGYQSYTVLSLCRILYTLHAGTVASKLVAARWAQATLGSQWTPLIERALADRQNPAGPTQTEQVDATLALIRYALQQAEFAV